MKRSISPVRIIAAGAAWRLFGSRRSANTLFAALAQDDEQNRMLAGMALVKAGRRTLDLVNEKIAAGNASPDIIRLLPDLDGPQARDVLEKLACGEPGNKADAAKECIDLLDRMDALEKQDG